eukprot:gene3813-4163_t
MSIEEEFSHCVSSEKNHIIYLDNASRTPLPRSVEAIGIHSLHCKGMPWLEKLPGDDDDVEAVRQLFADLIHANSKDNITYAPSTAFALTLAAHNIVKTGKLRQGQKVLLLEMEMSSAVYPWQYACKEVGASIKIVPTPDWQRKDASWKENILQALWEEEEGVVAVLALPQVHWCDGSLIDLQAISLDLERIEITKRPLLIVDATQSVGAMSCDITTFSPAFLACSVHKWLLGPYGLSLIYVNPSLVDLWEPLDQHDHGRVDSEKWDVAIPFRFFSTLDSGSNNDHQGRKQALYPEAFRAGARRLDAGGRPSFLAFPMLRRSLTLLLQWGICNIERLLNERSSLIAEYLSSYLFSSRLLVLQPTQRGGHILGIRLLGKEGEEMEKTICQLSSDLKEVGVHQAVRGGVLRLAPYLFSSFRQLHNFLALFSQLLHRNYPLILNPPSTSLPDLSRKVVLIIGGSSWLGQHLTRTLYAKEEGMVDLYVTYTNDPPPTWIHPSRRIHLDLKKFEEASVVMEEVEDMLLRIQPDVIVHLAAISSPLVCHRDPVLTKKVNAPLSFLEVVRKTCKNCRYIFTSTDMVYDGEHSPYTASVPSPDPVNLYGESKKVFESALLDAVNSPIVGSNTNRLKEAVVLRLSNMIGAPAPYRDTGEKFLSFLYLACEKRREVALRTFEKRSFVLVDDAIQVIRLLIHRNGEVWSNTATIFNVGGPEGLSRLDVAKVIATALGKRLLVAQDDPVQREDEEVEDVWRVKQITAPSPSDIRDDVPRSPRDITMMISATQDALNYRFQAIEPSNKALQVQLALCRELHFPYEYSN